MKVTLESITDNAERRMIRIARVSNPKNQDNPDYAKLLKHCLEHGHYSVFEHAHITLEIETSLAIATQILRHRSMKFQQFSARYSNPFASGLSFEPVQLRRQAEKNRQSSAEPLRGAQLIIALAMVFVAQKVSELAYSILLALGVARECARMVNLQCTQTRMYVTGDVRSWIHYLQLRTQPDTQLEHRQVALAAQRIFAAQLPVTAEALGWTEAK